MTGLGVEQPLHFSLSPHLTSLRQVYAEQWRGRGRSIVMRILLVGPWAQQSWAPTHRLRSIPRALLITGAVSHTQVWCCNIILHLQSPASSILMFVHTLILQFSTFGGSLQDKAFFVAGILCFTQRFVSHHVACAQVIIKNVWWKIYV